MRYGHFDDEHREYIIERPDTPLPWINYLGSEDYFGLISNTAGGYSFYKDARLRRLTRYRYNNVPLDSNGRYVYIRDNDTGEFWSPTWQPIRKPLDAYVCRHGMGYTTIESTFRDIRASIRYFVPLGNTLEVWELHLANQRDKAANLSLFSFIEFALWDALDDSTNYQRNLSIGEVEVEDGVIYHKTEYRERRNHFAYFACSEPLSGFDTQRDCFVGPYASLEAPQVVQVGLSHNSIAHGWQPIGSHNVQFSLAPGEERTVIFLLGYQENEPDDKFDPPGSQRINKKNVLPIIHQFLQPEKVTEAFQALNSYWDELLSVLQVQTPDEHTNRMVNIWNAYQCMITFNMSRSASYYELGIGRGMGFRDSNQDLLGFVHMVPERARQRILDLAATQLLDGGAYHQYQPLTRQGNNDVGSNFNDDPLWLLLSTSAYIKETGDFSILQVTIPYDNIPGTEQPLYDHLKSSIRHIHERFGPHGLPLIGRADWNDCLNLNCFSENPGQSFQTTLGKDGKVAESVLIAGLFVMASNELAEIAAAIAKPADEEIYRALAKKMAEKVYEWGWDGNWFLRAYDDFGNPVGSHTCAEGQIFIEPQGICVMAGIGLENGHARQALDSVKERLATPHGIVLQQPAYSHYHLNLGEISTYPPGYKENAGIFCHANPWVMIAETRAGNGNNAFDYYSRINPSAREKISEIHRCEPYVYAQMIAGKDAPTHGEAKNSWLTGTAAWNYVAITQWILGIHPTLNGLQVAPVMPQAWDGFTAVREYRGVRYNIQVQREGPGNDISLYVDGSRIEGSVIPLPAADKKEIQVIVKVA